MNELIEKNLDASRIEFDIQIATAKKFPRDVAQCMKDMIDNATVTPEIAESCYYNLPRAGKEISGPSIRLAEIAFNCWGNTHIGKRVIGQEGDMVKAEAVAWDLQKNNKINTIIERKLYSKTADMVILTGNAAASIALRNALFAIIPKSIIDEVYRACRKAAVGEGMLFIKKRVQVFERFKQLGINESEILNFFKKKSIEEFDEENLADLIGVGTAIKEGLLEAKYAFEMSEDVKQMDVKSRLECILQEKKRLKFEDKDAI